MNIQNPQSFINALTQYGFKNPSCDLFATGVNNEIYLAYFKYIFADTLIIKISYETFYNNCHWTFSDEYNTVQFNNLNDLVDFLLNDDRFVDDLFSDEVFNLPVKEPGCD